MLGGLVLLVCLFSWWVSGRLSSQDSKLYLLDHPNQRSLHSTPTPRTGGLAILGGLVLGLLSVGAVRLIKSEQGVDGLLEWWPLAWIVTLSVVLAVVSFLDDRQGLPVWGRFCAQIVLASLLVIGGELAVSKVVFPLVGTWDLGPLSIVASIVFLVWMTNVYNFMDGMDGFAGGMTIVGGLSLAFVSWTTQHEAMALLPLLLAGSSAGFLVHNFPPARIFMGDVGSAPIGFIFGGLILWGCRQGIFDIWVPVVIFSPFIMDATVTIIRRTVNGEKPWEAHRTHYYQRLVLSGWGHRKTVLAEYGLMILCGALAWAYHIADDSVRLGILSLWALLMVSGMVGVYVAERMSARLRSDG